MPGNFSTFELTKLNSKVPFHAFLGSVLLDFLSGFLGQLPGVTTYSYEMVVNHIIITVYFLIKRDVRNTVSLF